MHPALDLSDGYRDSHPFHDSARPGRDRVFLNIEASPSAPPESAKQVAPHWFTDDTQAVQE